MEPDARLAAELYDIGDRGSYLRAAAEHLSAIFPSELIGWIALDGAAGSAEIVAFPEAVPGFYADLLVETADENPFFQSYVGDPSAGMWNPRRLSDLMTDSELYGSRTFSLALRPLGIDRQIAVLSDRTGLMCVRAWTIARLHRDFTDDEIELLHRLQPMLRLLERAYGAPRGDEAVPSAAGQLLTARETQILRLLGKGLTGVAVARLLGISPRTVAKHLEHAYGKLGCTNRVDALRRMLEPAQPGHGDAVPDRAT